MSIFTTTLGLQQKESREIMMARCHRIGKRQGTNKPRPIIARFVLDKEKRQNLEEKGLAEEYNVHHTGRSTTYHKDVHRNNGILAFHGHTSIYSNFFPAEIKDEKD